MVKKAKIVENAGVLMGNYYDAMQGMKFSWANFHDREMLKWSAIFLAGEAVAAVIDAIIAFVIAGIMMVGANIPLAEAINKAPNMGIVGMIAGLWLLPRVIRVAMRVNKISVPANPPSFADWLVLNVRRTLLDIFCWYDKKLLVPAIVLLAIAMICGAAALALNLGGMGVFAAICFLALAVAAWAIAMGVHSIRTNFSLYMFLRGDGKEGEMPKKSFDLVKGQTLEVFLAELAFGVILLICIIIVAIPMVVIAFIPCIGVVIDAIAALIGMVALGAFCYTYTVNVFKFFDGNGPAGAKPKAAKAGAPKKAAAKKAKKKK